MRKRRSFISGERFDSSRDDSFSKSSCISRVFLSRNSVAVIALPHGTNHQRELQFGALNGAISIEIQQIRRSLKLWPPRTQPTAWCPLIQRRRTGFGPVISSSPALLVLRPVRSYRQALAKPWRWLPVHSVGADQQRSSPQPFSVLPCPGTRLR